jgi:hypothetical protein
LGLFGWDGLLVGQVLFGIWELEGGLEAREGEIYVWTCGCRESGGCQSRNPFGIHGTQKRKEKQDQLQEQHIRGAASLVKTGLNSSAIVAFLEMFS